MFVACRTGKAMQDPMLNGHGLAVFYLDEKGAHLNYTSSSIKLDKYEVGEIKIPDDVECWKVMILFHEANESYSSHFIHIYKTDSEDEIIGSRRQITEYPPLPVLRFALATYASASCIPCQHLAKHIKDGEFAARYDDPDEQDDVSMARDVFENWREYENYRD